MNTDIRLSTEFFRHPKTLKLKRRLGLEGIISLQQLWVWVAQNRPDGNLAGLDSEDIVLAACWEGEEAAFVQTLIDLRWLDVLEDGSLCLHNWRTRQEYASKSEERKEKARKAADARWSKSDTQAMPKASADMPRNSIGTSKHSASNAQPMLKNACSNAQACNEHPQAMPLTEPILTEHEEIQDPPLPPLGEPDADAPGESESAEADTHASPEPEPTALEVSPASPEQQAPKKKRKRRSSEDAPPLRPEDWERWYALFPRKEAKQPGVKAWNQAIEDGVLPPIDKLLEALAWQIPANAWTPDRTKYIPLPATYINARRWQDEPPIVTRASPRPQGPYQQPTYGAKKTVDEKVRSTAAGLYRILTRDDPAPGPMDLDNILDVAPINALAQGEQQ